MAVIDLERIEISENLNSNEINFTGQSTGDVSMRIGDDGSVTLPDTIESGQTLTVNVDDNMMHPGPVTINGTLEVDGSYRTTDGISGTGSISGGDNGSITGV